MNFNWNEGELERTIEKALKEFGPGTVPFDAQRNVVLGSQAISLKRIADSLESIQRSLYDVYLKQQGIER